MRAFDRVCEQFGFAMPSAACQRTATRSQKPHTNEGQKNIKTGKQSKNVKGLQRGLGRVGDYWAWFGSHIPACWLLMVVVISVDAQCVVFVFLVCVCVCACGLGYFLLPAYHVYKRYDEVTLEGVQLPSPSYQCPIFWPALVHQ